MRVVVIKNKSNEEVFFVRFLDDSLAFFDGTTHTAEQKIIQLEQVAFECYQAYKDANLKSVDIVSIKQAPEDKNLLSVEDNVSSQGWSIPAHLAKDLSAWQFDHIGSFPHIAKLLVQNDDESRIQFLRGFKFLNEKFKGLVDLKSARLQELNKLDEALNGKDKKHAAIQGIEAFIHKEREMLNALLPEVNIEFEALQARLELFAKKTMFAALYNVALKVYRHYVLADASQQAERRKQFHQLFGGFGFSDTAGHLLPLDEENSYKVDKMTSASLAVDINKLFKNLKSDKIKWSVSLLSRSTYAYSVLEEQLALAVNYINDECRAYLHLIEGGSPFVVTKVEDKHFDLVHVVRKPYVFNERTVEDELVSILEKGLGVTQGVDVSSAARGWQEVYKEISDSIASMPHAPVTQPKSIANPGPGVSDIAVPLNQSQEQPLDFDVNAFMYGVDTTRADWLVEYNNRSQKVAARNIVVTAQAPVIEKSQTGEPVSPASSSNAVDTTAPLVVIRKKIKKGARKKPAPAAEQINRLGNALFNNVSNKGASMEENAQEEPGNIVPLTEEENAALVERIKRTIEGTTWVTKNIFGVASFVNLSMGDDLTELPKYIREIYIEISDNAPGHTATLKMDNVQIIADAAIAAESKRRVESTKSVYEQLSHSGSLANQQAYFEKEASFLASEDSDKRNAFFAELKQYIEQAEWKGASLVRYKIPVLDENKRPVLGENGKGKERELYLPKHVAKQYKILEDYFKPEGHPGDIIQLEKVTLYKIQKAALDAVYDGGKKTRDDRTKEFYSILAGPKHEMVERLKAFEEETKKRKEASHQLLQTLKEWIEKDPWLTQSGKLFAQDRYDINSYSMVHVAAGEDGLASDGSPAKGTVSDLPANVRKQYELLEKYFKDITENANVDPVKVLGKIQEIGKKVSNWNFGRRSIKAEDYYAVFKQSGNKIDIDDLRTKLKAVFDTDYSQELHKARRK